MKKIVASVGLVALGATGLQTASAQDLVGPDTSKPWSVGLTLRGFYDDNPGTVANDISVKNRDSFGFEVSPQAAVAWSLEQTTINLGLLYSLKYYDTKPPYSASHDDQVFTFNAGLNHAFSEQVRLRVSDSFVIGQEPDLLRAGDTFATYQRISGDNIRNYGTLGLDAQLTPKLGLGFGYDNAFYDYNSDISSSTLDRIENRAHLEGLYLLGPQTKGLLGYRFSEIDYTANMLIPGGGGEMSDFRNSREHAVYVGAEHSFMPNLSGALRVGGSYSDYFNADGVDATWTPYVNASLKYAYAPESYVEGGFSYDRNATEIVALDAESAVLFVTLKHRLDARLFANLIGQFQNSIINGGYADNEAEQYYLVGLDLEYKFNQYFSGHLGYNYDRLESYTSLRTFDRNRVYIGVTASY